MKSIILDNLDDIGLEKFVSALYQLYGIEFGYSDQRNVPLIDHTLDSYGIRVADVIAQTDIEVHF